MKTAMMRTKRRMKTRTRTKTKTTRTGKTTRKKTKATTTTRRKRKRKRKRKRTRTRREGRLRLGAEARSNSLRDGFRHLCQRARARLFARHPVPGVEGGDLVGFSEGRIVERVLDEVVERAVQVD